MFNWSRFKSYTLAVLCLSVFACLPLICQADPDSVSITRNPKKETSGKFKGRYRVYIKAKERGKLVNWPTVNALAKHNGECAIHFKFRDSQGYQTYYERGQEYYGPNDKDPEEFSLFVHDPGRHYDTQVKVRLTLYHPNGSVRKEIGSHWVTLSR